MNKFTTIVLLGLSLGACEKSSNTQPRAATTTAPAAPTEVTAGVDGRVRVSVDGEGYHPATINAAAGRALTLIFTRTTDETCGQQVVFPDQNITKDLPLNRPVEVALTVPASGRLRFTCGMHMYQGAVVVQ